MYGDVLGRVKYKINAKPIRNSMINTMTIIIMNENFATKVFDSMNDGEPWLLVTEFMVLDTPSFADS